MKAIARYLKNFIFEYIQITNQPCHNKFLPPMTKLEILKDEGRILTAPALSSVDKQFIENKQDNSTEDL